MGRSTGSGGGRSGGGGGGGRSGGFSGGGQRSGSFSGGGGRSGSGARLGSGGRSGPGGARPAGGRSGGPRPAGGYDHGPDRPPRRERFGWRPHVHVGMPFFGGYRRPVAGGSMGCGGGCLGGVIAVILALVLISVLSTSLFSCGSPSFGSYDYAQSATASSSATVREKLSSDAVTKTDYYTDADGDWIASASRLTSGLEEFYDRTGVQPYVYILPNGETTSATELTSRAEELYGELFDDQGHFLLVFCDAGDGTYNCGYCVGTAASAVMDSEALGILADELDYAYNNAATDEEVFSDAFAATAERIMAAAEQEQGSRTTASVIGVVAVVVVVACVGVHLAKKRKEQQEQDRQRMEDILNTPLEQFGDKDVEDLAGKYEHKNGN